MKVLRILLVMQMLPILTYGQTKKLNIGLNFTPSLYILQSKVLHEYNSRMSFRGGVDMMYNFANKSVFSTGIYFSKISYYIDYYYLYPPPNDPTIMKSSDIKAKYIDVPFMYGFNKIGRDDSKYSMYMSTGIISSFLLSSADKTTYQDNSTHSSGLLNSFLLSIPIDYGFQHNYKAVGIKYGSQFRFFLNGIDKRMNQHPIGMHFSFGLIF